MQVTGKLEMVQLIVGQSDMPPDLDSDFGGSAAMAGVREECTIQFSRGLSHQDALDITA